MSDSTLQALFTFLGAIIGSVFTMQVYRGGRRSDTAREQLDTVYAKAFNIVEPVLFTNLPRKQCDEIVEQLERLSEDGGVLSSPHLNAAISSYKRTECWTR